MKRIDTALIEVLTKAANKIDQKLQEEPNDTLNNAFLLGQITTISGILDCISKSSNGTITIPGDYETAKRICEDEKQKSSCCDVFHQMTFDEYLELLANTVANKLNKE